MLMNRPMAVKPHPVSKLNTVAQIVLAGLVLASLGFKFDAGWSLQVMMGIVTVLTLLSIGYYVAEWIRHFGTNGRARGSAGSGGDRTHHEHDQYRPGLRSAAAPG